MKLANLTQKISPTFDKLDEIIKIRSMKFETVLIHFLNDVLVCCHPEILLPWQRDVTTYLYYNSNYKLQVTRQTISIQQEINYVFVFCN